MLTRPPCPPLRPFVKVLWATTGEDAAPTARERVLPTGNMHIVFRLDAPLRLFDDEDDLQGRLIGTAVIGGARASAYLKEVSRPSRSVGAQLCSAAAAVLLGVAADELANRHTALDEVWGNEVELMRERLATAPTLEARLDNFEAILLQRLPRIRGMHPAIAFAVGKLESNDDVSVAAVASKTGYSHKGFIDIFRRNVGLPPKTFLRVVRFQRAVTLLARGRVTGAEVAATAGYADQPHFNRDFKTITGMSPAAYRRARVENANHVPVRTESTKK